MSRARLMFLGSWLAEKERDEVVEDEDARRARDDRRVHGTTDARRAARGLQAEVAARERHDHAEDDALDEPIRDIPEAEKPARHPVKEARGLDVKQRLGA